MVDFTRDLALWPVSCPLVCLHCATGSYKILKTYLHWIFGVFLLRF